MTSYEAGRAAYVAEAMARGESEDDANYWFTEGDPALHAAEVAAENGWLTAAEAGTADTWSEEAAARNYG